MSLIEPNPEMRRAGWTEISTFAKYLADSGQVPQLVEIERGNKSGIGPYRKLTYFVGRIPDSALVDIWLVDRDGRTLVNTLQGRTY